MTNQKIKYYKLNNGISTCIIHVDSIVSTIALDIKVGSSKDPLGKWGLAHFSEHMLFHKSLISKSSVSDTIDAMTAVEDTYLIANVLEDDFHKAVDTMYNMLLPNNNKNVTVTSFLNEHNIIMHEISDNRINYKKLALNSLRTKLFGEKIGHSSVGETNDVNRIKLEDVFDFQQRHYISDNIQFIILSCHESQLILNILNERFGSFEYRQILDLPLSKNESIIKHHASVSIPVSNNRVLNMMGIKITDDLLNHNIGFFLAHILGGKNNTNILSEILRERLSITYNVKSHYEPFKNFGALFFYYYCNATDSSKSLEILKDVLLGLKPFSQDTIKRYQRSFIIDYTLENENRAIIIRRINSILNHLNNNELIAHSKDAIFNLETVDIYQFYKRYIQKALN